MNEFHTYGLTATDVSSKASSPFIPSHWSPTLLLCCMADPPYRLPDAVGAPFGLYFPWPLAYGMNWGQISSSCFGGLHALCFDGECLQWWHWRCWSESKSDSTPDADQCVEGPIWKVDRVRLFIIQWLKKLIHTKSKFSLEAGCASGNKAKPMRVPFNKGDLLGYLCTQHWTFRPLYWINIDFTMGHTQWISFCADPKSPNSCHSHMTKLKILYHLTFHNI